MAYISAPNRSRRFDAVGIGQAALAGGVLDLGYAFTRAGLSGAPPSRVLQSIASGWQGRAAYEGGAASAVLGAVTHFGIAGVMAATLSALFAGSPSAARRPLAVGAAYGFGLYAVMYGGVLPVRWPAVYPKFEAPGAFADIAVHVAVGVAFGAVLSRRRRP